MSIYIKGMEMPKQGRVTLQIGADGAVYVVDKCEITAEKYEKNFDVLEVPPHGRLIDSDALSAKIIEIVDQQKYDDFYAQTLSVGAILREVVNDLKGTTLDGYANAPTIVPADKDGE